MTHNRDIPDESQPTGPSEAPAARQQPSRRGILAAGALVAAALGGGWLAGRPRGLRWTTPAFAPEARGVLTLERHLAGPARLVLVVHGPLGRMPVWEVGMPPSPSGTSIAVTLAFPPVDPEPGAYRYAAEWWVGSDAAPLAISNETGYVLRPFFFGC